MNVINLPIEQLVEAPWNANTMSCSDMDRLRESLKRYGLVENLVVRVVGGNRYEVLGGNHRLKVLCESGFTEIPCVVVALDDANARVLAQALNGIHGEDDIGLKAELVRKILETMPVEEVAAVLPETADSLRAIASVGTEDMATYLKDWQKAQKARLKHMIFQITQAQQKTVDQALAIMLPVARQDQGHSPNARGTALYLICKSFLEKEVTK